MKGDVASAHLHYIVRDHDSETFARRQDFLREITEKLNAKYGGGTDGARLSFMGLPCPNLGTRLRFY